MNDNTLVTVHGYAGDAHQVDFMLPGYLHHQCPVTVVSPEDSQIRLRSPRVEYLDGGQRAYIGELSLQRQLIHMKMLLDTPYKWFLANDADSVCLARELPEYLYQEDVFWSNEVSDMMHNRPSSYTYPRLAFQPPYFFSRRILQMMVDADKDVVCEPQTPFIDWYLMALAVKGNVPHKNYPHGVSCPTRDYPPGIELMQQRIRHHGAVFLHSIKDERTFRVMVAARDWYCRTHEVRVPRPPPRRRWVPVNFHKPTPK